MDSVVVNNIVKFDIICPTKDISDTCIVPMTNLSLTQVENEVALVHYYHCKSCKNDHRAILYQRKLRNRNE